MKYAADDVEAINKRMKELEAEKVVPPLPLDGLPSDVEPIAMKKAYTIDEYWQAVRELQAGKVATWEEPITGPSVQEMVGIYGDPFWDVLVRNGVIKIGEA